jgi:hypothetical protein
MWGRCKGLVGACLRGGGAPGLCLALCLLASAALAQSDQPTAELFTGFEVSDNYASVYVGGTTALGKGLYEPGCRLRAVGSFGRYHYDGTLLTDGAYVPTTFDGQDAFLAALAGYQFRKGRLITKLFAGLEQRTRTSRRTIPTTRYRGARSDSGSQPRTGSTSRPSSFSRSMPPTELPFRNIVRSRAWAFAFGRALRSGSRAVRSAMRNIMPGRAAASCASICATPSSPSLAASPATICKICRVVTSHSASTERFERRSATIGPRCGSQIALPAPLRQCLAFQRSRSPSTPTRTSPIDQAASRSWIVHPV